MSDAPRLTLVSTSMSRAAQLTAAGFVFDRADPRFDDPAQPTHGVAAPQEARMLAGLKALSRYDLVTAGRILLSADTIVTSADGEHIGKPGSRDAARSALAALSGRPHQVVTGIAVLTEDDLRLAHAVAEVLIAPPGEAALEQYLDSGAWTGAAGAYRLADLRSRGWSVTASLEPVGGLPIALVSDILGSFGVRSAPAER